MKFALAILGRTSESTYKELGKVMYLPSLTHVKNHRRATTSTQTGYQRATLRGMKEVAKKREATRYQRTGVISFDSMKIRDGLLWDASKGKVMGIGIDSMDPNLMISEYKRLAKKSVASDAATDVVTDASNGAATGAAGVTEAGGATCTASFLLPSFFEKRRWQLVKLQNPPLGKFLAATTRDRINDRHRALWHRGRILSGV